MLESLTLHLRITLSRLSGMVYLLVPGLSNTSHTNTITMCTKIRLRQMKTCEPGLMNLGLCVPSFTPLKIRAMRLLGE